jgi:flavorubredoxin
VRPVEIKPGVYWVGVNDRFTQLFEGFWPIEQEGISYNAYLLKDEKNVLIDLAKSIKTDELFEQIEEIIPISDINYVVINHLEPDHTGIITILRKIAPQAEIIVSEKGATLLKAFYHIDHKVRVVKDQEELRIGKKILRFYSTPFVHWPETMMTYEVT